MHKALCQQWFHTTHIGYIAIYTAYMAKTASAVGTNEATDEGWRAAGRAHAINLARPLQEGHCIKVFSHLH